MSATTIPHTVIEDIHTVVRTRRIYRNRRSLLTFLADLASIIEEEHVTGQVLIAVSQGSFSVACVEESSKLAPLPLPSASGDEMQP